MEGDPNSAAHSPQNLGELSSTKLKMAPSLHSLPLELILLIFELGSLKVGDAMMLRSLCTQLFDITESRTFWLCVARLHERDCPFPIPPSCPRESMTIKELKNACFKAHSIIQNIASAQPEYKDHRTLSLPDSTEPIGQIIFLPGGRYAIIAHCDGLVRLVDLHAEHSVSPAPSLTSSASQHQSLKRSGKCLASYHTASSIWRIRSVTSGNRGEVVTMVTHGSSEMSEEVINVVTFTFLGPDQVQVENLFRTNYVSVRVDGIDISDTLVAIVSDQLLHGYVMQMMLIDYRTGRFINVRTAMDDEEEPSYDVLIAQDGHVLLCKCTTSELVVSAYFDVKATLFGSIDFTNFKNQPVEMTTPPQSSIRFPYTSSFPDDRRWITLHQWPNTRDRSRVAIVAELMNHYEPQEPQFHQSMVRMHWMDINEVIGLLKAPNPAPRTIHPASNYFRRARLLDLAADLIRWEGVTFGSFVRYAVWCLEVWQGRTLEIVPLPGPFDDEEDGSSQPRARESLVRKLRIPSALGRISTLLFCDQTGILAITFDKEQTVHLFNY